MPSRTFISLSIFSACLVYGATAASADVTQWAGNNHYYEAVLVGSPGINWEDAQAAATARGGYLASITSSGEDTFVYGLISSNNAYWYSDIGGNGIGPWLGGIQTDHLAEPGGHWAWTSGEAWSYTNWMPFEPSNGAGWGGPTEDYLQFAGWQTLKAATWNDYRDIGWLQSQDGTMGLPRAYIVEWNTNPAPEPATCTLLAIGAVGLLRRRRPCRR